MSFFLFFLLNSEVSLYYVFLFFLLNSEVSARLHTISQITAYRDFEKKDWSSLPRAGIKSEFRGLRSQLLQEHQLAEMPRKNAPEECPGRMPVWSAGTRPDGGA
jgi:hypothetical protein